VAGIPPKNPPRPPVAPSTERDRPVDHCKQRIVLGAEVKGGGRHGPETVSSESLSFSATCGPAGPAIGVGTYVESALALSAG
jgi:hypothetical protein